jgi:WD40 repeat protein
VSIDWSKDSHYLAATSLDSRVRIVHLNDFSRRTKFKSNIFINENLFMGAHFVSRERRLLAVSETGNICAWDVHSSSETNSTVHHSSPIFEHPSLAIQGNKKIEATASCILRHIGDRGAPLNVLPDQVCFLVADTKGRISVLIEVRTLIGISGNNISSIQHQN